MLFLFCHIQYVHMSIGPIFNGRDFNTFMPNGFSTPWTDVQMLLVVATSLNVGTLNAAFKQVFEFAVVEDSIEDKALAIEYNTSTFGQFLKANSRQVSKVKNIQDGLRDVASGKKALILNNLDRVLTPHAWCVRHPRFLHAGPIVRRGRLPRIQRLQRCAE